MLVLEYKKAFIILYDTCIAQYQIIAKRKKQEISRFLTISILKRNISSTSKKLREMKKYYALNEVKSTVQQMD